MESFVEKHGQAIDAIRKRLEAFTTSELEELLTLNRRITPPPDFPADLRRDHELRQELTLEILNARLAEVPVKWPVCATAEDYAAGKRTMCQHVDVKQPDGSNMRFHCRVVVDNDATEGLAPKYSPGWLARTWRKFFPDLRTDEEIFLERIKWL